MLSTSEDSFQYNGANDYEAIYITLNKLRQETKKIILSAFSLWFYQRRLSILRGKVDIEYSNLKLQKHISVYGPRSKRLLLGTRISSTQINNMFKIFCIFLVLIPFCFYLTSSTPLFFPFLPIIFFRFTRVLIEEQVSHSFSLFHFSKLNWNQELRVSPCNIKGQVNR